MSRNLYRPDPTHGRAPEGSFHRYATSASNLLLALAAVALALGVAAGGLAIAERHEFIEPGRRSDLITLLTTGTGWYLAAAVLLAAAILCRVLGAFYLALDDAAFDLIDAIEGEQPPLEPDELEARPSVLRPLRPDGRETGE